MALPSASTISCLNTPNKSGSFYPNDAAIDMFLRKLSFEPLERTHQYQFSKASAIPTVDFFDREDSLPQNPTNIACGADVFQRVGEHLCLDEFDQIGSNETDQLEEQIRGTKLGILRQLSTKLITGTAPELIGLDQQITAGHGTLLTSSNPVTFQDLYKARYTSKASDGLVGGLGGVYFVGNQSVLRQILYLFDQRGKSPKWKYDAELGVNTLMVCRTPFLVSNAIPNFPTFSADKTAIYVLQLRGATRIRMYYAKSPFHDCDPFGMYTFKIPLQSNKNNFYCGVEAYLHFHVPEDNILVKLQDVLLHNIT